MKKDLLKWWLLLCCLAGGMDLGAQQLKADRDRLAEVKKRAEKGDAGAQLELASCYVAGTGVGSDLSKAVRWYRKAAEQGLTQAQYELARSYLHGMGVKADPVEGAYWLRKAAEKDLVEAQVDLGLCYAAGRGVTESGGQAVEWFRKAAGQGSPAARFQIAKCYFEGAGVTRDLDEAIKWVREAADQGLPAAQYRLGQCYEKGEGVEINPVEAHKWYNLAASLDDEHAMDIRVSMAKLETGMSREQVAQAQKLAREFRSTDPKEATTKAETNRTSTPTTGTVSVMAEDSSEIFVDGAFAGNPPARLALAPGRHVIEVKHAGFEDYRRELTVTAGSDLTLRPQLPKK